MYKIPIDPWENMSLIADAVMAGEAFSYLENDFIKIYERFYLEKEQILRNYEEERNWERYIEISIYNSLFIILGCAMIELWVNSFGIHLLNEDYYHKNIERMGIIEKIKILIAIHKKEEIDDSNENIKNIRKLFDRRNGLVHPKAKRLEESLMEDLAFDPKKIDNKDYLFVKKTLKDTQKFFKDNEIIPYFIDHIKEI
jgi:hypothetical protein